MNLAASKLPPTYSPNIPKSNKKEPIVIDSTADSESEEKARQGSHERKIDKAFWRRHDAGNMATFDSNQSPPSTSSGSSDYEELGNRDKQPIQFDPEIERTLRRLRKQSKLQQETLEEVSHQGSIMADNENSNDNLNENQRRTLGDYTIPITNSCGSSTVRPTVAANNFELKPSLIRLVQQDQFSGSP
ncbi:hypothetical protein PIB30_072640 [Stylosanthes scabra]|uniref:Uncharacterized protein n=1 Tax=Stylosanthes scabra TaxID=79078 RepID=A0ABU6VRL6_9FABA|nr:hypothetical protein [Stylosanthes scabra]